LYHMQIPDSHLPECESENIRHRNLRYQQVPQKIPMPEMFVKY
jgi:hypothetical protein